MGCLCPAALRKPQAATVPSFMQETEVQDEELPTDPPPQGPREEGWSLECAINWLQRCSPACFTAGKKNLKKSPKGRRL